MGKCNALLLLCVLFTACQVINSPVKDENDGAIYRPPTPAANEQSINQVVQAQASAQDVEGSNDPSQQSTCTDNLVYIADQTIPDGTEVPPGEVLNKRWEVENQGTCNWGENYRLKLIAGSQLSSPLEQALFPARSGTKTIISIQLTAPQESGNYRSAWQAYSPSGEPFGDPIFIEIVVSEGAPSS